MLTFPIASSPLSNKKMIPKKEKKTPNPAKPSPTSVITTKESFWLSTQFFLYATIIQNYSKCTEHLKQHKLKIKINATKCVDHNALLPGLCNSKIKST